ncbi:MAG: adenylyltransferase/cytidyltransferase family protein [Candidatus Aenigmarchaeota archaeon]|nr:adenylyltransferase/cytidyltransferase family protein [Candidatus Aenigmarchaeota archaeon]
MNSKIGTADEIPEIAATLKAQGKKIITTNGAFDILHAGHVRYLREAKKLGDILIIGVNTDESVKAYKNDKRPIVALEDRMELLSALEFVDYVFPFAEKDPRAWLAKIKPAVHVKGGDYKLPLLEQGVVEKNGGKVVLIPAVPGKSTTGIIEKIRSVYCV